VFKLTVLLLLFAAPPGDAGTGAPSSPPADPAAKAAASPDAEKPTTRWELGTIDVEGAVPKPGVVFVEAERERLRSVMQALVAETRAGGLADVEVSRPSELPTRAPRIKHIKARGPLKVGAVLRALDPTLGTLQACRAASRTTLPTDITVSALITLDEEGQVLGGTMTTVPRAPRVGHCVLARLKRGTFPPSPAGRVKLELEVVLPPPYAAKTAQTPGK
jgi:hypothetical protein